MARAGRQVPLTARDTAPEGGLAGHAACLSMCALMRSSSASRAMPQSPMVRMNQLYAVDADIGAKTGVPTRSSSHCSPARRRRYPCASLRAVLCATYKHTNSCQPVFSALLAHFVVCVVFITTTLSRAGSARKVLFAGQRFRWDSVDAMRPACPADATG